MGILFYDGNRILTEHIRSVTSSTIRKIPVLGEISCGLPFSEYQTDYEYMDIPESFLDDGEYFVLKANGDSMKDVGIDHEDSVIIKVQIYADIGDIVVALDQNGQNTLKRLMFDGNCYYLHPENSKYDDIYMPQITIQGVAKKIIKDLI